MTIIASLRGIDDDELFLAADSRTTDRNTGFPTSDRKLDNANSSPVAWGFSGDVGVGREFGRWLQSAVGGFSDWWTLRDRALYALAGLNGRKRELLDISRQQEQSEDVTEVLIAGFIGGRPEVLELDARGGYNFYGLNDDRFFAIGSGAAQARIVAGIARDLQPTLVAEELIRYVMQKAVPISPHCGFPAHILRLTADKVTRLTDVF